MVEMTQVNQFIFMILSVTTSYLIYKNTILLTSNLYHELKSQEEIERSLLKCGNLYAAAKNIKDSYAYLTLYQPHFKKEDLNSRYKKLLSEVHDLISLNSCKQSLALIHIYREKNEKFNPEEYGNIFGDLLKINIDEYN